MGFSPGLYRVSTDLNQLLCDSSLAPGFIQLQFVKFKFYTLCHIMLNGLLYVIHPLSYTVFASS